MEYFHVQHTLFAMSDKRKYIKNPYAGKKRKAWNKPTKPFPNKWNRKFNKTNKGSYYNQGKWINEHEYKKGRYYIKYYDDDLDLVTTDESSCSGESEAESKWEMFEVQDKQLGQHVKLKWSIFWDQLSMLFRMHSRR